MAVGKLSGGVVFMVGTHKPTAVTCTCQLPDLSSATVGSGTAKAGGKLAVLHFQISVFLPSLSWRLPLLFINENDQVSLLHAQLLVSHDRACIDIRRMEIRCMEPRGWLNDEVINYYMALLQVCGRDNLSDQAANSPNQLPHLRRRQRLAEHEVFTSCKQTTAVPGTDALCGREQVRAI